MELRFQPLTLAEIPLLRPYFVLQPSRICDSTIGGTFLWRDYFQTEYATAGDTLFLRSKMPHSGETVYSIPMDGDVPQALRLLREDCARRGETLRLFTVPAEDLPLLRTLFPGAREETIPHWADYLYNASDLRELRGKHYAGQRNHISQFTRAYPDGHFEPLTPEMLPRARAFFRHFEEMRDKSSETFREDERKVHEVLDNYALYGFLGGAIVVGDQIVSMAIGEVLGDTLYVHIEKADLDYHGAYPMIVREFSRYAAGEAVLYINREDDAGDPGLQKSKQSYKPCAMLEKYLVTVE